MTSKSEIWYRFIFKWLTPFIGFWADFFKQLGFIFLNWIIEISRILKMFSSDVISPNLSKSFAAFIALITVLFIFFVIPVKNGYDLVSLQWKIWTLAKSDWKPMQETETWLSIEKFTNDYSNAFGRDCEWFKNHAVGVLMWRNNGTLRHPTYSCPAFSNYSRTKLFPINVGTPIKDREVITVDALLGRVDFDQQGAQKYTSVQTSLWKLVDENEWRINTMSNKQKHEFR